MAFPKRSPVVSSGPAQKPAARPVAGSNNRPAGNATVSRAPKPKTPAKHTGNSERVVGEFY